MHIVTIAKDSSADVRLSLMALPYGPNVTKTTINWRDSSLESAGWTRKAVINGGLFFSEGTTTYANGVERAYGVTNEDDDSSLDSVMGLYFSYDNESKFYTSLQSDIPLHQTYGAITGAFGLLKNGVVNQGNTSLQGSYTSKSGRSMIGQTSTTIYLVATAGVTGSTGLTGAELLAYAQQLNLTDAVALDGGGSVGLVYDDAWKVQSTRLVKNAIGVYVRTPTPAPPPVTPPSLSKPWGFVKVGGAVKQINKVKARVSGSDKTINKIFQKIGGVLKQVFQYEFVVTRFPQQYGTSLTWTGGYTANGYVSASNNPYLKASTSIADSCIKCSSVHASHGMPPSFVFTGDTYWTGQAWKSAGAGDSSWISIRFEGTLKVTSYRVYGSSMGHQTLDYPKDWQLQGSNDGSSWTTIDTRTGQYTHETWGGWYSVSTANYYRYFKFNVTANGGACGSDGNGCDLEVNEIEFQGVFRPYY